MMSRDVVDDDNAHNHDAHKLAAAIIDLYDERTDGARRTPRRRSGIEPRPTASDLVAALRAELAAIEPARRCDRVAERAGSGRPRKEGPNRPCSAGSRCGLMTQ